MCHMPVLSGLLSAPSHVAFKILLGMFSCLRYRHPSWVVESDETPLRDLSIIQNGAKECWKCGYSCLSTAKLIILQATSDRDMETLIFPPRCRVISSRRAPLPFDFLEPLLA